MRGNLRDKDAGKLDKGGEAKDDDRHNAEGEGGLVAVVGLHAAKQTLVAGRAVVSCGAVGALCLAIVQVQGDFAVELGEQGPVGPNFDGHVGQADANDEEGGHSQHSDKGDDVEEAGHD